ncbi:hypothetical protein NIES4073_65080 [Kalymmatonema gypsitolerans NIES-4073]|nr:hypothetical protein NIES4073_65080 [Scytonema sp. NIES-4073]
MILYNRTLCPLVAIARSAVPFAERLRQEKAIALDYYLNSNNFSTVKLIMTKDK